MLKNFTQKLLLIKLVLLLYCLQSSAQTIGWNFSAGTAVPSNSTVTNLGSSDLVQGNNNGTTTFITSSSVSSGYTGASGTFNAGLAARTLALNTAASGSAYIEFTVTPSAGYSALVTGINFGCRSTSTGPQAYTIRTNLDNYTADIATGSISNNSAWSLKTNAGLNIAGGLSQAITIRIYGYNGTGTASAGTANFRFDDLSVTASASLPAISNNADLASLSINPGTFSPAFNPATVSYAASVSNTVNAVLLNFTRAQANSSVDARLNGGAYNSPLVSMPLNVGTNTIDVRVIAQDGITTKIYTITILRAAPAVPVLTIASPLPAIGNICINTSSTPNTFTLDGSSLDGSAIVVSGNSGFYFSETASGVYANPFSFTYSGNAFAGKLIYVKYSPTNVQSDNGNLLVSGGGHSGILVPVLATAVNTLPSVVSGTNTVAGTSANLLGTITVTGCSPVNTYGFEYSTTQNFVPGTGTQVVSSNLSGTTYSKTVSGLAANTIYYYRAFAGNNGGLGYGTESSFTTSAVIPIIMASQNLLRYTENFSDITNWSANFVTGSGANHFAAALINTAGTIPVATKIT
ncbi:MAG: hypothetical protein RLZZ28_2424, partial [Bacteroidota bacterium]